MSTKNTMSIKLTCNNRELVMGPGEEIDIVKVTGLYLGHTGLLFRGKSKVWDV